MSWEHRRGGATHYLARVHHRNGQPELHGRVARSSYNPDRLSVTADAAGAVLHQLPTAWAVRPDEVTWPLRLGVFSSLDPVDRETVTRIALRWEGDSYRETHSDDTVSAEDYHRRNVGWWPAEPVAEVVAELERSLQ